MLSRDVRYNIAHLHETMRDYETALAYFKESLALKTAALGEGHEEVAINHDSLAKM